MKRTTFQVHHYSPLPLLCMLTRSDRRENNESTLLHSIKCQETPRCAKWSGAEFQHKDDLLQSSRIVWLPRRLSIFQLGTHLTLKVLHCAHFNLRVSGTSKKLPDSLEDTAKQGLFANCRWHMELSLRANRWQIHFLFPTLLQLLEATPTATATQMSTAVLSCQLSQVRTQSGKLLL